MDWGHKLGAKAKKYDKKKLHRVRKNTQDQPGVEEGIKQITPHRTPWCKKDQGKEEDATQ